MTDTTAAEASHAGTGYTADTQDQYNRFSEAWNLGRQARRLQRVISRMRKHRATTPLIEFGALAGGFAEQYSDALGLDRSLVFCSDFAEEHLATARQRGFRTLRWDLEAATPPELGGTRFSTVLLCEVIEHLVNPEVPLRTIVDAMAPGGLLFLTTPNLASLGSRLRLLLGRTPSVAPGPGLHVKAPGSLAAGDHLRVCVAEEWVALLRHAGLEIVEETGCTSGPLQPESMRSRLTLGLNTLLEKAPGRLFMNTLLVARKPAA